MSLEGEVDSCAGSVSIVLVVNLQSITSLAKGRITIRKGRSRGRSDDKRQNPNQPGPRQPPFSIKAHHTRHLQRLNRERQPLPRKRPMFPKNQQSYNRVRVMYSKHSSLYSRFIPPANWLLHSTLKYGILAPETLLEAGPRCHGNLTRDCVVQNC